MRIIKQDRSDSEPTLERHNIPVYKSRTFFLCVFKQISNIWTSIEAFSAVEQWSLLDTINPFVGDYWRIWADRSQWFDAAWGAQCLHFRRRYIHECHPNSSQWKINWVKRISHTSPLSPQKKSKKFRKISLPTSAQLDSHKHTHTIALYTHSMSIAEQSSSQAYRRPRCDWVSLHTCALAHWEHSQMIGLLPDTPCLP